MKNCLTLLLSLLVICLSAFTGKVIAQSKSGYAGEKPLFPLKISPNSRYLVDQNNKPFPILGRTAWFVISQPEEEYKVFIDHCVSFGYNSIEMHVLDHDPRGNHPPFNGNHDQPFLKRLDGKDWSGSLVYGDLDAEAPDMTTPNEKYWRYVDAFLSYCESKGVMVFFFPAYVGYVGSDQGWMEELIANGTAKSTAYGAWVARRYKNQKNMVWMLLGDMGRRLTVSQKNAEAALIRGLKSVPGQQSIHYSAEADAGQNSIDQPDFGQEMTLNGVYTWGSESLAAMGRRAYSHKPPMPAYLLEEPYDEEGPDGNNVNPHALQPVRKYQWWGWLTSGGGYIAGNGYVWPFVDPLWKKHLDTQGSRDMMRLNSFIRSIPWWELVPSEMDGMRKIVTEGGGKDSDDDFVSASATTSGTWLVAYIPPAHKGSISVDLKGMGKALKASWFDPTNGQSSPIAGELSNTGTHLFTPQEKNSRGDGDWVLVVSSGQ